MTNKNSMKKVEYKIYKLLNNKCNMYQLKFFDIFHFIFK